MPPKYATAFDPKLTGPGRRNLAGGEQTTEFTMAKSTMKWFNETKCYGLIAQKGGKKGVFVHITALERAGRRGLKDGQAVSFDIQSRRDGCGSAINIALAQAGLPGRRLSEMGRCVVPLARGCPIVLAHNLRHTGGERCHGLHHPDRPCDLGLHQGHG